METKDRSVSTRTRFSSRFLADPFAEQRRRANMRGAVLPDLYLPCGLRRNFMKARPAPLSLTKFVKSITVSQPSLPLNYLFILSILNIK